ncbi:exosortase A [Azospirillum sp. A1-3]|uniref:exosortase A n=1 Tax=Azospirillum sp. A1-3 TaxID=185874 RepID=UPI002077617C|nr:exosortase A [Azospirillum sp. A1-3]MCM8738609.1 exosortase A [Azospirillum sp. A1-3]
MSQANLAVGVGVSSRGWPRALGWLALYVGLCLVLFHATVFDMVRTWLDSTAFNHGVLILPIALVLIWRRRLALAALRPQPEPWALLPLALGSLGWLLGSVAEAKLAMQLGFVGMLIAVTVATLGARVAWCIRFPLLFLFTMVPFGDVLVPQLQAVTAGFAVALLRLLHIPVFLDGVIIELPSGRFHVAEACAGLRFMIANVVMAVLFAHLAFRRWWKSVLFVALGGVVPIIANGLRAFGIIMIAHLSGNQAAVEADHVIYGWGFFVVIMLLLLAIGNRFADAAPPGETAAPLSAPSAPARWVWGMAVAPVLAIAVGPVYALSLDRVSPGAGLSALPAPLAPVGWQERTADASRHPSPWRPGFADADARRLTVFQKDGRQVELFVAYYSHERPQAKLVRYENRFDDDPWMRVGLDHHSLPGTDVPAIYERLAGPAGQRTVLYWYWVDGRLVSSALEAKLRRIVATLGGGPRPAAVIALSTEADPPDAALATLDAFAAGLPTAPAAIVGSFAGAAAP